jgi:NADH:ubiquinone oxidoreductase subunit F (NADH-binding)
VTGVLTGLRPGRPLSRVEHTGVHGPLGHPRADELIDAVARTGLAGRGGAGFPTARKLAAVAGRRGAKVVVANGVEAEPMSAKDLVLLTRTPHLVLDGLRLAAGAVGAGEAILCVPARARDTVAGALAERDDFSRLRARVAAVPQRYLAGEETALVRHLDGGPLKPTFTPPRPFERGVRRRPTLVQNVETLAQLALIARQGPGRRPTLLVSVSGAVRTPGVVEVAAGTPVHEVIERAGGPSGRIGSVVLGGYFGAWLPAATALALPLEATALAAQGAALGAGVVVAVPEACCAVAELARVAAWLAAESAGQCGPCAHGLPAIAGAIEQLRTGRAGAGALERIEHWARLVAGRGACRHPDGAARLVRSALGTLAGAVRDHARHGPCDACFAPPLLETPA